MPSLKIVQERAEISKKKVCFLVSLQIALRKQYSETFRISWELDIVRIEQAMNTAVHKDTVTAYIERTNPRI